MTKATTKLAMRYLKAWKYDKQLNNSLAPHPAQFPDICEDGIKAAHLLNIQAIGWNVMKDKIAACVVDIYSKEELDASIAFLESDLGRAASLKNLEFSKRISQMLNVSVDQIERQ